MPAAPPPDLTTLLAQIARGDRAALRALYVRQSGRLFGIAMAILRDRPAAADVLQDGFLAIWDRARLFDPARAGAEDWLAAIIRQAALTVARAQGREAPADAPIPHAPAPADPEPRDSAVDPDALDALAATQAGARLRDILVRLQPQARQAVVLAFVHGLSPPEIARKLGQPLDATAAAIRRGLRGVRDGQA